MTDVRTFEIELPLTEKVREYLAVIEERLNGDPGSFQQMLEDVLEDGLRREFIKIMVEEYPDFLDDYYDNGTDEDRGFGMTQVLNGDGYYDEDGMYHSRYRDDD